MSRASSASPRATRFVKKSEFSTSLAKLLPIEKGPLTGLPSGPFVLVGGGPWSDSLAHGISGFQSGLMKKSFRMTYGLDEKQAEQLAKKALDTPKGVHALSMLMGTGQPGEPIMGDMLFLYQVNSATKYLEDYEKHLAAMNESGNDLGKKDTEKKDTEKKDKDADAAPAKKLFPAKKTQVGGRPAVEYEMPAPPPPKFAPVPGFDEKMVKIFGPGGKIKTLLVAIDDHTIALSFTGRTPRSCGRSPR